MTISGVITLRLQGGATGLGHLGIVIGDNDPGPGLPERLGAGEPDALSAARDDGRATAQFKLFQIHRLLILFKAADAIFTADAASARFSTALCSAAHVRMTPPCLSKRCRRAWSGNSHTRSPAFRSTSPMAARLSVSVPSFPAST